MRMATIPVVFTKVRRRGSRMSERTLTMDLITVMCSRCGTEVEGIEMQNVGTGGFYRVIRGEAWDKYGLTGETILCDDCMHRDTRYIADYGQQALEG